MDVKAFLVADNIEPGEEKKLKIEGIFSSINVKDFPIKHELLYTYFNFEDDKKEEKQYKYELFLKIGELIGKVTEVNIIKVAGESGHSVVSKVNDISIFVEGEYEFFVKIDGKEVARRKIEIKKI